MIILPTLTGETAVFGLGRSGLATVKALLAAGNRVVAWDDNLAPRQEAEKLGADIRNLIEDFGAPARLIVSPGVPLTHPAPHPIIIAARAADCAVLGDIDLFIMALEASECRQSAKLIGITGTNGKSTTTALVTHMLNAAGWDVHMGGNIGVPVLDLPMPNKEASETAYVLELSSYQLDLNRHLSCDIGVLLNITPDHLDRHGDMAGYVAAKEFLFAPMQSDALRIIGQDDGESRAMSARQAGATNLVRIAASHKDADIFYADGSLWQSATKLLDMANCPALPGPHNGQNAAAALAVGQSLGLDMAIMTASFAAFGGMAHRLQSVRKHGKLNFVNDSKATNSEATRHALAAFDNIYWIAGGIAKQGGLAGLSPFYGKIRAAYLIGEAAPQFADALSDTMPAHIAGTMDKAVSHAATQAATDDCEAVILLSPACASFDQFTDFEARGDAFCAAVSNWCAAQDVRQQGGAA